MKAIIIVNKKGFEDYRERIVLSHLGEMLKNGYIKIVESGKNDNKRIEFIKENKRKYKYAIIVDEKTKTKEIKRIIGFLDDKDNKKSGNLTSA